MRVRPTVRTRTIHILTWTSSSLFHFAVGPGITINLFPYIKETKLFDTWGISRWLESDSHRGQGVILLVSSVLQIAIGDVIGWVGLVTVILLLWSLIYFLIMRGSSNGNGGKLDPELTKQLKNYDRRIDRLLSEVAKLMSEVEKLKRERDNVQKRSDEYEAIRSDLDVAKVIATNPETPLLAVIGPDEQLEFDLASLRAVERETGMEFRRVKSATLGKMKQYLDRARINGRPFDKVHMSVHAGADGLHFADKVVSGEELSEVLIGVKILLIAGCESSITGDFMGAVPFVITITEEVNSNDATLFARAFWTQIGKKKEPPEALNIALDLAPTGMSEYVENHW